MSLCRRLQKLSVSDGVRRLLTQAIHRSALIGQYQDSSLVPSEAVKHVHLSPQGQSWPESMARTEHLPAEQHRQGRISIPSKKNGPGAMSKALVQKVMGLSDVKEDVYGALDEWAAFELEFPVAATRIALDRLRQLEQWHRVIQVTKWMFSKGVGKTHGSYILLLKACCMNGRLEEAEEVWNGLLVSMNRSMPKLMFAFMSNAYRRRDMPDKVIQVFEQMENLGIKPDKDILRRVTEAYQQLNMEDKVEQLGKKYAIDSRTRRKEKRQKERKGREASKHGQLANKEDDNHSFTDDDEEDGHQQSTKSHEQDFQQQITKTRVRDERTSFETGRLANKEDNNCSFNFWTDDDEEDAQQQFSKSKSCEEDSQQQIRKARVREERASLETGRLANKDDICLFNFWTDDEEDAQQQFSKSHEEDSGQQITKSRVTEERASFEAGQLATKEGDNRTSNFWTDDNEEDLQQQVSKSCEEDSRQQITKLCVREERASFETEENPSNLKISTKAKKLTQQEKPSHVKKPKKGKKPAQEEKPSNTKTSEKGKKLDSLSPSTATDEEFVKQIIATM